MEGQGEDWLGGNVRGCSEKPQNWAPGAATQMAPPSPRGSLISWDLRNSTGVAGEAWDEKQLGAPRTRGRSAHTLALRKESASCHMVSKHRPPG